MPPTSQTAIVAIVPSSVSATRATKPTDFDAIQSIPFDDDHNHMTSTAASVAVTATAAIDGDTTTNDSNAHAGVLKKLTSYFSSSHKTLINLNNSSSSSSKNGCHNQKLSANSSSGSSNTVATTDTCAVFENCNAKRSSSTSSLSLSLSSAASSLPPTPSTSSSSSLAVAAAVGAITATDEAQLTNESTAADGTAPSQIIPAMTNLNSIKRNSCSSCSSSSLSANSMKLLCGDKRDVDKCDEILNKTNRIMNHKHNSNIHKSNKCLTTKKPDKIDYGASPTAATAAAAKSRSPNKRAQKIDGGVNTTTGESFTLPRVVLRQR